MDYQVAFYEHSWQVEADTTTADIIKQIIDTRDATISQLRLPDGQQGKVDNVSCGIWLKIRTDRVQSNEHATTAFTNLRDRGLHQPVPFSYMQEPLSTSEIRLVELLPGSHGAPLQARLRSVRLEEAPAFIALSYVWGAAIAEKTVILGQHSFQRQRISSHLSDALDALRRTDVPCFVWVDLLSINQASIEERATQVSIMGKIFASAAQVVIWLGQASEYSRFGMRTLQFIADGRAFDENPPWKREPPELIRKGLTDVLTHTWFKRIWTVQEAALSNNNSVMLYSDGSSCTWSANPAAVSLFARGLKFAAITADWRENGLAGSEDLGLASVDLTGIIALLGLQLQQIVRNKGIDRLALEPDLLDIAYEIRDRESLDPRDRLYAILGLAEIRGLDEHHQLHPNYSKPLHEVQDEFRRILRAAAKKDIHKWVSTS